MFVRPPLLEEPFAQTLSGIKEITLSFATDCLAKRKAKQVLE
jgi:hypothetical protein